MCCATYNDMTSTVYLPIQIVQFYISSFTFRNYVLDYNDVRVKTIFKRRYGHLFTIELFRTTFSCILLLLLWILARASPGDDETWTHACDKRVTFLVHR